MNAPENEARAEGGKTARELTALLRQAGAAGLRRLLRRPGLRPGGRAAGGAAALIVALMLAVTLWPGPRPPQAGEAGAVPVSTSGADQYLNDAEIEKKIIDYLALNAWAEQAGTAAAENPGAFPQALTASPSPDCAARHRSETVGAANPDPDQARNRLMRCIAEESAQEAALRPSWEDMPPLEREIRSRAALRMLWDAVSPETAINVRIAWQTAAEVNRRNNYEFRRFAAEYAECGRLPDRLAPGLAALTHGPEMAAAWLQAVGRLRGCAASVNARLFPQ